MKIPFLIACCLLVGSQLIFGQKSNQAHQFKKVEALLHRHYKPSSPGVAVAIIAKGKTVYTGQLGQSDLEHGVPITDSTAFHIASVSKQFTAYLALLLEKEGRLSLDDDVRQHLPELQRLPYRISLRQLANHTHGLPNLFELARLRGIGIADHMTHREVVELLLQIRQVNFEPGARYEYNNTGYVLLAEVLERVSGKPFQELLRERIFTPLGMRHSRAVPNSAMLIKNKAKSYRFNDGAYENNPLHLMANGSSGISTTLDDLRKWAVHFQEPSAQAQEILRQMQETTRLNTGNVIPYGLGLECKKYKGLEVVFHGGGDAGYRSYLLHVPRHQLSVVILGNNNDFTPLTLVYEIVDLLLKEHLQEPVVPGKLHYTTGELKAFEGTYEMFPGTYYNIIAENDTLYFQAYGTQAKAPLPVIGDGDFLFPYLPASHFSFYKNGFDFHIADFTYTCTRVHLSPPKPEEINLAVFTGLYRNKEFNTVYEIMVADGHLVAVHSLQDNIRLSPLTRDSFYSNVAFFGKVEFVKDPGGQVVAFRLSGQNLRDITFHKIE